MNCKFEETAQLILTAAKYVPIEKMAADCAEHMNFFGKPYVSDIVDVCDGVWFEVMSDKDGGTVGNYVTVFFSTIIFISTTTLTMQTVSAVRVNLLINCFLSL